MGMKKMILMGVLLFSCPGLWTNPVFGADPLPADFPQFKITQNGPTAPGLLIGSVSSTNSAVGSYFMIMDNNAAPVFYSKTQSLGTLECNGLFSESKPIPGQQKKFTYNLKDRNFTIVDSFAAKNGYMADNHDFQVLPNGHVLILIYDTNIVDMSKIIEGGHPSATVSGAVIQELDCNKNLIWQWRTLDHIPIIDSYKDITTANFGYVHVNSVAMDPIDGNIILSCREASEVVKVSRATGEIMWQMTGKHNEFTFINEHPENAPRYFKLQHDVRRLSNGNLTIFDNGADEAIGDQERQYSRAVEYALDEVNKTATMVWEYRNTPDFRALTGGSATRLSNGNTVINWGGAAKAGTAAAMTEANPSQQLVYEIWPSQPKVTGGFQRIIWPLDNLTQSVIRSELLDGNTYDFNYGDQVTGVKLKIASVEPGYNEVQVKMEPFAPLFPAFPGKTPRVLPVRITISGTAISYITADILLDAVSFGFADRSGQFGYANPDTLTIYYRPTVGLGQFTPLAPTTYNPVKKELKATMTNFGEFMIGLPDVQEVALAPILIDPADQTKVNQTLPVSFFWTPRGFGRYYQFQVSEDDDFENLAVNEEWLSDTRYSWSSAKPETTYYYRVRTKVYGADGVTFVEGDWSTASFRTIQPTIEVIAPKQGDRLVRGLDTFIQWTDNLTEKVAIELYKGGSLVQTIGTSAVTAYEWEVGLALMPGCDYSIKIKSSVDANIFDTSDLFSIAVPAGDFNCDGCVGPEDLTVFTNDWLKEQGDLQTDLDHSGRVDIADLAILAENWMKSCV
jgi:hypothetical protein